MFSVTSAFLTALQQPTIQVGIRVTTTTGVTLSVVDGSVTMDARRNITRTCELNLTATATLSALEVYNLLLQPDMEVNVSRGVMVNGAIEYVPLGIFSTDTIEIDRRVTGTIRWSGSDRAKKISRARFTDPYQITSGTTLANALTTLLQSRWAQTTVSFTNVLETIAATITYEAGENSDPWDCARQLAADHGYDLNFDGLGIARAVAIPDPAQSSGVFDFGSGTTNLITGANQKGSLEKVFNGVIVTGEGTNVVAPVRAEAWDTDPSSPTYYQGGYGKVPLFYSSPLITTTPIAQVAAQMLLAKLKGRMQSLSWPAIVNPALEPLDVVTLSIQGLTSKVVIDSLQIPLRASDPMTANARETTIA